MRALLTHSHSDDVMRAGLRARAGAGARGRGCEREGRGVSCRGTAGRALVPSARLGLASVGREL